ncbi:uncharacterized protein LOC122059140 [Macadamia integrifolia]|uniref:uncharacterized protein LOC122059140 n=1 Tax=Macadamia integrifolia TaxID=60698 RepID=UPI001C5305F9|nr:uncharacterized protein LOC122059140 [Macadamia integrifolia]
MGGSRNGQFSIKSAYYLLSLQRKEEVAAISSSSYQSLRANIPNKIWNFIWNCHSLPKVRSFLWRACANGVASAEGLNRRQVPIDPSCLRCGATSESIDHVIYLCTFAKKENTPPSDVIQKAKSLYEEFCKATRPSTENACDDDHPPCTPINVPWSISHGEIKINSNASYVKETSVGALGFIFREHPNLPILAVSVPTRLSSITSGEAEAIKEGILNAISLGYFRLQVDSDNLEVIRCLLDPTRNAPLEILPTVEDIRFICSSPISCSFNYVPRAANGIVDSLARKGLSLQCMTVWPNSTPWLLQLCNDEAAVCNRNPIQ